MDQQFLEVATHKFLIALTTTEPKSSIDDLVSQVAALCERHLPINSSCNTRTIL